MAMQQAVPAPVRHDLVARGVITNSAVWTMLMGGRSNRVWRLDGPDETLICKLYSPLTGNPLYPNLPGVEYEMLKALHAHDIAPEPVVLLNTGAGDVLVYRHISGSNWQSGSKNVARLLARLHEQVLGVPLRLLASGSSALIRQTEAILAACPGDNSGLAQPVPDPKIPPIALAVPIHTDVVASNIIELQAASA